MSTYLKNIVRYKPTQLKSKSYDEIQKLFDKEMKRVNTFVAMDSEVVEGSGKNNKTSEKKAESSKKRTREVLDDESVKRQKLEDDAEKAKLKACLEIDPRMWSGRLGLEVDHQCEMAFEGSKIIKFTVQEVKRCLDTSSFDVIIGMDWLAKYHTIIDYAKKIVRIPWGNKTLIAHGDRSNRGNETRLNIISCTKAQKYLLKGHHVFLTHVTTKETEDKSGEKRLEDVPIIQDFPEVFPKIAGVFTMTRQVEFRSI
ncbi:putative reverse transcriptase domain-containing protein [Tanacetum coccineum]